MENHEDDKKYSEADTKFETIHIERLPSKQLAPIANDETVLRVLLQNPKVILFCLCANIGAFMYGYDNLSLTLCLSMPPFQRTFGTEVNGEFLIPAYWQSLWNAVAQIGTMIGAGSAGTLQDRLGRRLSFFTGAIISVIGVSLVYVSSSPGLFLVGKTINGAGVGICLTTGQTYVSEISPTRIRGVMLGAYSNLGNLIAASVGFSRIAIMSPLAYKLLFAIEWIWPCIIIAFVLFSPESPHYLVRKDDNDKAARMLQRILPATSDISAALDEIVELKENEVAHSHTSASFIDCFRGTNWRRTRIILYCNGLSQMVGAAFLTNGPYFMIQAGMSSASSSMIIEIGIGLSVASAVFTLWLIGVCGRRIITLSGIGFATALFFAMGVAGCFPKSSEGHWTVGITLQLVWLALGPSIAPAMAIAGEISEIRLRAKSQAIGFAFNYFWSCVWNVIIPYMFNQDEGNLGGLMGWIFFGASLLSFVIVFLELPETKDVVYERLDRMFEQKVPARRFGRFDG
ncbi:general substrate transporter [Saccharata proteae CBS 121410]|uniref:General substrate transporter n=1 Tax=Saccharata proteae CBS 121410 TaxID=1314787 RepID=A0A9P4HPT6_9PEZI|nr:general substrate transporter [Saccharata proteae CBS 121410]